jgi:hypothetical protein
MGKISGSAAVVPDDLRAALGSPAKSGVAGLGSEVDERFEPSLGQSTGVTTSQGEKHAR